jgi:hypothetical protein
MSKFVDDLSPGILRDWMLAACGKKLGGGVGRTVFVYDLNPNFVIKIEESGFQNVIEWEMWKVVKASPHQRWLAPVRHISPSGAALLMDRTLPAPRSKYPKRMPEWIGDYKYSNFGLLNGRLVCHDYGSFVNQSNGINEKMRKADWWDSMDGSTFDDGGKA